MRPLLLAAALSLPFTLLAAEFRAGAAKRTLTPDLAKHGPVFIAGFGQNRVATGIHDDLFARCLALHAGARPLVLCGVDSIGLFFDDVKRIRAKAPEADVIVAATHVHQAPDTMGLWGPAAGKSGLNEAYVDYVVDRTAEAVREAIADLRPAVLRLAKVSHPDLDSFIHDTRPPVRHDAELVVLAAEDAAGRIIGTLLNWANHPEALDSKNTLITSDYPAYLHPVIEKKTGGVSVFINGAVGGMQSPLGAKVADPAAGSPARQGTFRFAELIGARVAELALDALHGAARIRISAALFREELVHIPMENAGYQLALAAGVFAGRKKPAPDGSTVTPVGYVLLEDDRRRPALEIALIPGEMYPELSVGGIERYDGADFPQAPLEPAIKQQMKAPYRMLFGLANDEIGYIIPKAEWDASAPWLRGAPKRWYGEVNAVGPEAAPRIAGAFSQLVSGR
ncbi:MAG TPA: hypothetical protein DEH78_11555 [Solibacterales bacterium]|nr:hypothetical protein [Bryobacterales bacterium]